VAAVTGAPVSPRTPGISRRPPTSRPPNAICVDAARKSGAVPRPTDQNDLDQWSKYLSKLLPISIDEVHRLAAIAPPDADRATANTFLGLIDNANAATERARKAAAAGSLNGFYAALKSVGSFGGKAAEVGNAYGLRLCGKTG
jgi:hypothetical protein